VIPPEFSGTVVVTSPQARAEIVGVSSGLSVRFATVRDMRTFRAGASAAAPLLSMLPPGTLVWIQVGGREIARLGGPAARRWTPAGVAARLTGLPVSGVRPRWWLGR
jgi:hypothetical protein